MLLVHALTLTPELASKLIPGVSTGVPLDIDSEQIEVGPDLAMWMDGVKSPSFYRATRIKFHLADRLAPSELSYVLLSGLSSWHDRVRGADAILSGSLSNDQVRQIAELANRKVKAEAIDSGAKWSFQGSGVIRSLSQEEVERAVCESLRVGGEEGESASSELDDPLMASPIALLRYAGLYEVTPDSLAEGDLRP